MFTIHKEGHFVHRSNWLRAAILGANDGILSIASLILGVASTGASNHIILVSAIAALTAGSLSMAAGEYVSVSSQGDLEKADLDREAKELINNPEAELIELTHIYTKRGVNHQTAKEVAIQLTAHNALEAHAKDELGINEITEARPLQAAFMSAVAFILGGLLPLLSLLISNYSNVSIFSITLASLALLGFIGAYLSGANIFKSVSRIVFWGIIAMFITSFIGSIIG